MACPFFDPQRRLDPGAWTHQPRLPLGDAYGGLCCASEPFSPEEEHQRECCNRGYARGVCQHFSASSAADAVRFSVAAENDRLLRIVYIFEKDHAPLSHGELEVSIEAGAPAHDLLARQARAFAESYFKTKARTGPTRPSKLAGSPEGPAKSGSVVRARVTEKTSRKSRPNRFCASG
jgi:hypothetical protein